VPLTLRERIASSFVMGASAFSLGHRDHFATDLKELGGSLPKITRDNSARPSGLLRRMLRHTKASPYRAVKRPTHNRILSWESALVKWTHRERTLTVNIAVPAPGQPR
jgi:hypothetical protein